jgi:hypothetical protein
MLKNMAGNRCIFLTKKKNRATFTTNSIEISKVLMKTGCADIMNENIGRVSASKKAFLRLVWTIASTNINRIGSIRYNLMPNMCDKAGMKYMNAIADKSSKAGFTWASHDIDLVDVVALFIFKSIRFFFKTILN